MSHTHKKKPRVSVQVTLHCPRQSYSGQWTKDGDVVSQRQHVDGQWLYNLLVIGFQSPVNHTELSRDNGNDRLRHDMADDHQTG